MPSWIRVVWFLALYTAVVWANEQKVIAFRQACNQANIRSLQGYLDQPGFVDSLTDEVCSEFMATAIHSAIYGHPRGHEVMNLLATLQRFRVLGPLGTVVVEKAMFQGDAAMAIHILSSFDVEETSACLGLVAAAKAQQWQAIEELFQHHENSRPELLSDGAELTDDYCDEPDPVIIFEAGALRDFLILTSEYQQLDYFWKAVEMAREAGSVDLEQFLIIIDEAMAASTTFDQLAAFVNLLMNDAEVYSEYTNERKDIKVPFAGQFLKMFLARGIIMDETGIPDELGNSVLDYGVHDLMYKILARDRLEKLKVEYLSSSYSSETDQVNEEKEEEEQVVEPNEKDNELVDLAPLVLVAPTTKTTDFENDADVSVVSHVPVSSQGDISAAVALPLVETLPVSRTSTRMRKVIKMKDTHK